MNRASRLVDGALEALVVPSFTRIGYSVRRSMAGWRALDDYSMSGQVVVITGGTSGLGKAAASQMASVGAHVVVVGRTADKNRAVADHIAAATGGTVGSEAADMGEPDQVRSLAEKIGNDFEHIDALIHNAGVLAAERRDNSVGIEQTVASQVVGPFLLTGLLFERLEAFRPGRVITMSSGGMYTAPLTVSGLQMSATEYRGSVQYAKAKRAQVTLNEQWAERTVGRSIRFHALHPGWADTPGVETALPGFRKIVGPLLRDADQGADTMVWLAADDGKPLSTNGRFWLDRRIRSIHKLSATRDSDTPDRRGRLWNWVEATSGWQLPQSR